MLDGNEDDNAARGEKAVADEESLESDDTELLNDEEESTEDEDEEVDEDEDEEENEDEDEEEEDVELEGSEGSETSETDESTEGDTSDSDESVWSTRGEIVEATHEAEEALSMRNFHRALELMIENKEEKAVEIFKKLLRKSYISRFERPIVEIFFDEDITEDKENKLSKMGKLFVAIHKNLAKLEEDQAIYHYLQVLNLAPNNPEVWFDVAIKSVHTGDLNFAKSAFRKCDFVDSAEARATTLFISYDYKECLTVLREFEERGHSLNDKMIFLKNSIRSSSDYHKELCDEIFQENERYNGIKTIHMTKMNEYKSRIEALENKIRKANEEKCADIFKEETLEPVFLDIFYDQDLETVGTIFCDLYDRIEAFSSLHRQKIVFREWGDRRMYFDVKETLEDILDVVEVVEDLTEKVSKKAVRQRKSEFTWSWTPRAAPTVRIFEPSTSQDSSPAREEDSECDSGCETTTTSDEDVEMAPKVVLPKSDLATSLRLSCSTSFEPIEPPKIDKELLVVEDVKFFDEEAVLEKLRGTLMGKEMRMFDVLEAFLLTICDFCPNQGAVPEELKLVLTQCYRRLINIDKRLMESKYLELHQLMYELDELEAQTYCRRAFSEDFPFFTTEDQLDEDFRARKSTLSPVLVEICFSVRIN
ncbi:unnamed protein product [Caenorhabditis auriculariae]|uniref:Uncharacterized protein n=1 Tax=Caenorhabditis auriculariae TaxID=2777116 RepID=A0A8S1HFM2_9PELO|nr:unnamed protein product [Caenorhabditis auriculariae]